MKRASLKCSFTNKEVVLANLETSKNRKDSKTKVEFWASSREASFRDFVSCFMVTSVAFFVKF